MEYGAIIAYIFGLLLLYIIGSILLIPLKLIIKLVYNGVIGGILLWLLNLVGQYFGLYIAINPITALVAGFLGIPGIVVLVILSYIL
ncbi:MAG: pro-sigmaK processing inhibitor BofA family protein [bacterium]|jgi:inhibitor of the pro-sigma K processing machinery